jgi:hypothetical protein
MATIKAASRIGRSSPSKQQNKEPEHSGENERESCQGGNDEWELLPSYQAISLAALARHVTHPRSRRSDREVID